MLAKSHRLHWSPLSCSLPMGAGSRRFSWHLPERQWLAKIFFCGPSAMHKITVLYFWGQSPWQHSNPKLCWLQPNLCDMDHHGLVKVLQSSGLHIIHQRQVSSHGLPLRSNHSCWKSRKKRGSREPADHTSTTDNSIKSRLESWGFDHHPEY